MPKAQRISLMQPFLMAVLEARLSKRGMTRNDVMRVADGAISPAAMSRLASGEAKTSRLGIDAVVDLYAEALGVSPMALWRDALRAWARDPEGAGLATRQRVQRRTAAASRVGRSARQTR